MGLQKYLDRHGTTHSGIGALKVPFMVRVTKMPMVNPGLAKSQSWLKSSQNNTFHVSTSNFSYLEIFVKFDQIWPKVDSLELQKL